jgi:glycosyltransferase involved in cell wall biosynthesis
VSAIPPSSTGAPLSILHVYKDYAPVVGGIENHVRALAEAQVRAGHRVTVLVANRAPRTEVAMLGGVRVIRVARWATVASTPIAPGFFRWLPRVDADIMHLQYPHPPGEVAWLLLGKGRRMVVSYQSDIVRQRVLGFLYRPLMTRVLDRADAIIATSQAYVESSPELTRRRGRCSVVPLGIDVERFSRPPAEEVASLRERLLPDTGTRPVLLFVGCLRYYKGLDVLLRALVRLPGAVLLVIGDGPMRSPCEALARNLSLSHRVVFAGQVSEEDLPACYRLGDLFVLPANSRAEAFGTVLAEAMASGLPVVSTELDTGTSWVNEDGVTGLVVAPSDAGALAAAVGGLLADPERRARLGAAARTRAVAELSRETMVARVEEVYRGVLEGPGPSGSPRDR